MSKHPSKKTSAPEQVSRLIWNTYVCRIVCAVTNWGGQFALYEQNNPPKCWVMKSEMPHLNFTTPPIILAFVSK